MLKNLKWHLFHKWIIRRRSGNGSLFFLNMVCEVFGEVNYGSGQGQSVTRQSLSILAKFSIFRNPVYGKHNRFHTRGGGCDGNHGLILCLPIPPVASLSTTVK